MTRLILNKPVIVAICVSDARFSSIKGMALYIYIIFFAPSVQSTKEVLSWLQQDPNIQ